MKMNEGKKTSEKQKKIKKILKRNLPNLGLEFGRSWGLHLAFHLGSPVYKITFKPSKKTKWGTIITDQGDIGKVGQKWKWMMRKTCEKQKYHKNSETKFTKFGNGVRKEMRFASCVGVGIRWGSWLDGGQHTTKFGLEKKGKVLSTRGQNGMTPQEVTKRMVR